MSKNSLRIKILKKRKKNYNKSFKINFQKLIDFLRKKKLNKLKIGGYYPINYEIDAIEILKNFKKKGHKISLPVIKKNHQIRFFEWTSDDPLFLNKYGIPEPRLNKEIYPNLILVPMVAFDRNKFRLGYGGGYYDRYLQKNKNKKNFISVGFAFSFQEVKKLPTNKYDKKLDFILTEKEIF